MNNIKQANIQIKKLPFCLVWILDLQNFASSSWYKNGDVKIIKNAGGVVSHAFGSVVRSLLVAIFELGVEEIMVIGHTDCGVQHINSNMMIGHMINRGVSEENIDIMKYCGIDFEKWLEGFDNVETSVHETVKFLKEHPLIPKDVRIAGYVMDSVTGELNPIEG